mmetsp:Transcript_11087/g.16766  ORF Transcript_11087/g.16766 Transcript_11087/m.16766 type:complete len:360 (+) Transcript_11087:110-1189(+)
MFQFILRFKIKFKISTSNGLEIGHHFFHSKGIGTSGRGKQRGVVVRTRQGTQSVHFIGFQFPLETRRAFAESPFAFVVATDGRARRRAKPKLARRTHRDRRPRLQDPPQRHGVRGHPVRPGHRVQHGAVPQFPVGTGLAERPVRKGADAAGFPERPQPLGIGAHADVVEAVIHRRRRLRGVQDASQRKFAEINHPDRPRLAFRERVFQRRPLALHDFGVGAVPEHQHVHLCHIEDGQVVGDLQTHALGGILGTGSLGGDADFGRQKQFRSGLGIIAKVVSHAVAFPSWMKVHVGDPTLAGQRQGAFRAVHGQSGRVQRHDGHSHAAPEGPGRDGRVCGCRFGGIGIIRGIGINIDSFYR